VLQICLRHLALICKSFLTLMQILPSPHMQILICKSYMQYLICKSFLTLICIPFLALICKQLSLVIQHALKFQFCVIVFSTPICRSSLAFQQPLLGLVATEYYVLGFMAAGAEVRLYPCTMCLGLFQCILCLRLHGSGC